MEAEITQKVAKIEVEMGLSSGDGKGTGGSNIGCDKLEGSKVDIYIEQKRNSEFYGGE